MSNLKKIRKLSKLKIRTIEKYTSMSNVTLSRLENGVRPLRQIHIETLSHFYNTTTDFILGNSEDGIYVQYFFTKDGAGLLTIDLDTYTSLYNNIEIRIEDNQIIRILKENADTINFVNDHISAISKKKKDKTPIEIFLDHLQGYLEDEYIRQIVAMLKEFQTADLFAGGDGREQKQVLILCKDLYSKRFRKDFDIEDNDFYINLATNHIPKEYREFLEKYKDT